LSKNVGVCFNGVVTLRRRTTHALRTILLVTLGTALVGCGIPWGNLQNGSHSDAARDGAVDVRASIDALGDASDTVASDAADITFTDQSMDVFVARDTPTVDVRDASLSPDVRDASIAPDVPVVADAGMADSADLSDVQPGCYGVSSSCSASAPCCAGLTCSGGTCTSSCLTYAAFCGGGGGCCAGLTCTVGYCAATACEAPHQSCTGTNPCCVGLTCEGGICVCPIDMASCRAAGVDYCADLNTDRRNCGSCGRRCGGGQMCVAGACL